MRPKQKFSTDKSEAEALQQFLSKLSVNADVNDWTTFNHPKRAPFQHMYAVVIEVAYHRDLPELQSLKELGVIDEVTNKTVQSLNTKTIQIIGVDTKKLAEVEQVASLLKSLSEHGINEAPYKSEIGRGQGLFLPRENVYFAGVKTEADFIRKAFEYLGKGNSVQLIQNKYFEIKSPQRPSAQIKVW